MKMFSSLIILSMTVVQLAQAQIQAGQPSYAGTGCTAGHARIDLSSNQSILSVTFEKFEALAGGSTGRRIDRKACAIRIPFKVVAGYQVSLQATDYRTLISLPNDGQAVLDASYYFVGSAEATLSKTFDGPHKKIYRAKSELKNIAGVASECGKENVVFGINISERAVAGLSMQKTQAKLTSAQPVLTYKMNVTKCP